MPLDKIFSILSDKNTAPINSTKKTEEKNLLADPKLPLMLIDEIENFNRKIVDNPAFKQQLVINLL